MGAPTSLLGDARAFARDFPRDKMPRGYLWDVADYVPLIIDAPMTGRGGWRWGSAAGLPADVGCGILATFTSGEQLLVQSSNQCYVVSQTSPYSVSLKGAIPVGRQNPVQYMNDTVWFETNGAHQPYWADSAATGGLGANAPNATVGTVWGQFIIAGGVPTKENILYFGPPNNVRGAWDVNSFFTTSLPITGLAALRSVILVFHASSTERIRGSTPPFTGDAGGSDLVREPLFARAGTTDPRSLAYWNENVLFADEHGVHITDGAVIRNLVSQGGISYYWRPLYANRASLAACVFLDYYIITVRASDGTPYTLICDLNKRQWFRFTNVNAVSYISSGGSTGMERIWASIAGTGRLARIGPTFFPTFDSTPQADDNGVTVLPSFETPWYRLSQEGRKRVRFAYLSYDARGSGQVLDLGYLRSPQQPSYTSIGGLPATTDYRRFRLPVGQFPYGVAFRVRQTAATTATRVFDLGVEAQAAERSRV